MVYLRNGRLSTGVSGKLRNKYGPCKILKKINDNANVVDLPEDLAVSSTFNVADIFEYFPLENLKLNSMTSSFQECETDVACEFLEGSFDVRPLVAFIYFILGL
jgi:hypothetical protein